MQALEALGINLGYLISQVVNFTLLALLLYFVAYKPILRMLDQRSERIQQGLQDAEVASRRAAEMEQEYEQKLQEVNDRWGTVANNTEEYTITPYKKDIYIDLFGIGWLPN